MYNNDHIASQLKRIGKLLEIQGENPFKIRAYFKGSDILKAMTEPIENLIASGELGKTKGIGDALRQKILDIHQTGTCPLLTRLESEIPPGVADMLKIKGLGPKKIQAVWQEMDITSMGELLYACNENRLVEMKGFGEKTQEKIRKAIEYVMANEDNFQYASLRPVAEDFLNKLGKALGKDAKVSLTGDIRRKMPVLSEISVLAESSLKVSITAAIPGLKGFELNSAGTSLLIHPSETTIPIQIQFAEGNFWLALWKTTGSPDHIELLQVDENADYASESAIYECLGMQFIEPEMREGMAEVELAKSGNLPKLIEFGDIKGMMHNHSTWSDGLHSLEEMAVACRDMGMEYLGISDHSRTAAYAGGLSAERVLKQQAEIDQLNAKMAPFKILKGIESDILSDGSLDYTDEVLATFDFVIASVHSILNMDEARATERLITAIKNPFTTMLGHPTGRLLLIRQGYPINHRAVIDACAEHNVMIEINANPNRLDLDWSWVPYALEKGVMISINPDAHKMQGYQDTQWGIEVARKGGLSADRCFNAQDLKTVEAILAKKRSTASA